MPGVLLGSVERGDRLLPDSSDVSRDQPLVRAEGLEPSLPCEKRILSPLRLPFRHARAAGFVHAVGLLRHNFDQGNTLPRHGKFTMTIWKDGAAKRTLFLNMSSRCIYYI